jgi:hypothetical protein
LDRRRLDAREHGVAQPRTNIGITARRHCRFQQERPDAGPLGCVFVLVRLDLRQRSFEYRRRQRLDFGRDRGVDGFREQVGLTPEGSVDRPTAQPGAIGEITH